MRLCSAWLSRLCIYTYTYAYAYILHAYIHTHFYLGNLVPFTEHSNTMIASVQRVATVTLYTHMHTCIRVYACIHIYMPTPYFYLGNSIPFTERSKTMFELTRRHIYTCIHAYACTHTHTHTTHNYAFTVSEFGEHGEQQNAKQCLRLCTACSVWPPLPRLNKFTCINAYACIRTHTQI